MVTISNEKTTFEKALEEATGETIESLRNKHIDQRRKEIEAKSGKPMRVISRWPFIGRTQAPQILTSKEVNSTVDEALK